MRNKIKPSHLRCLERPLHTVYGLPRHVRQLIGEEVVRAMVGLRLGDSTVIQYPSSRVIVLWRCRDCGGWAERLDCGCDWCDTWDEDEHVRELKAAERTSKRRAKSTRKPQ